MDNVINKAIFSRSWIWRVLELKQPQDHDCWEKCGHWKCPVGQKTYDIMWAIKSRGRALKQKLLSWFLKLTLSKRVTENDPALSLLVLSWGCSQWAKQIHNLWVIWVRREVVHWPSDSGGWGQGRSWERGRMLRRKGCQGDVSGDGAAGILLSLRLAGPGGF